MPSLFFSLNNNNDNNNDNNSCNGNNSNDTRKSCITMKADDNCPILGRCDTFQI